MMNAQEQAQLEQQITDFMLAGGTLQELYGITTKEIESLYAKGFQEYNTQQYEKALQSFGYLVYLQPNEKRYLFAFAAVMQALKDYRKAIYYYTMAAQQDLSEPTVTLHIAECLIALHMHEDALAALDILCRETASVPQWSALHAKAVAYQSLLAKKQNTDKNIRGN